MQRDYETLKIASYEHWTVYVHESQYFLGRCYIWSKRPGLVDLTDTTTKEWDELKTIGQEIKGALTRTFSPDFFNWAALGNVSPQCHLHLIPRYASPRTFTGHTFTDRLWGANYASYDKSFVVDDPVLFAIRDAVTNALSTAKGGADGALD